MAGAQVAATVQRLDLAQKTIGHHRVETLLETRMQRRSIRGNQRPAAQAIWR
jgi:hypothetical protein